MSADQVAEIAPGIRESIAGGDDLCVTYTVTGDESRWVQFVNGVVNAAYPDTVTPVPLVARLGDGVVESYEVGKYVTVRITTTDAYAIARWIDGYFEKVLGVPGDYSVDCSIQKL